MARVQLIELEDQPWFPSLLRKQMQEYLEFMGNLATLPFERFADRLADAMRTTGDRTLIDLCSGGSGPVPVIVKLLGQRGLDVTATLTDLYPNLEAFERAKRSSSGKIDFVTTPVDARAVPDGLKGFRLLCNSFHHLPPDVARGVLEDAARKESGIAIIEIVGRSAPGFLNVLVSGLLMLLFTPFVRPFRWSRFVLTYLVPLIPICTVFDGLVSCLRVYSPAEMKALTEGIAGHRWEMGLLRVGNSPIHVTYLFGVPSGP